MKKSFLILSIVFCMTANLAFADAYADRRLEKRYRKAMNVGCEYIQVKDPATATALGFILGGGSFYTGQTWLGVAGALTWPISIIWDAPMAHDRAEKMNREETVTVCRERGYKL